MTRRTIIAHLLMLSLLLLSVCSSSGQKKEEILFSDPIQIDSSEWFMIPRLVDQDMSRKEVYGKGAIPWGAYSDIIFFNTKTNTSRRLFGEKRALIVPFSVRRLSYDYYREPEKASTQVLPGHVLYLARTEDANHDRSLDVDDPLYLFVSTRSGDSLRQVSPAGLHVLSVTLSEDRKIVLLKTVKDTNGNGRFGNGDDQSYYRVDLGKDIARINCYPLPF